MMTTTMMMMKIWHTIPSSDKKRLTTCNTRSFSTIHFTESFYEHNRVVFNANYIVCGTLLLIQPGADSGCTAVVAVLRQREMYVANAGDSRCVVCRAGKAIDMSVGRCTLQHRLSGGNSVLLVFVCT